MKRFSVGAGMVACLLAVGGLGSPAAAVLITDSFSIVGDTEAGDVLKGRSVEVGGKTWSTVVSSSAAPHVVEPFFAGDASNGYIKAATAHTTGAAAGLVPLDYTGTDAITAQADFMATTNGGWVGVGFTKAHGTFNANGSVWFMLGSSGAWTIWQDGTSKNLRSGNSAINATQFTTVAITYDPSANSVSASIGGTEVAEVTLNEYTPLLAHAGFQVSRPRDATGVDNFKVESIPEPASLLLLGGGAVLLACRRSRA